MKLRELKEQVQQANVVELQERLEVLRRELFSLRLNASTAHVKDYSQFKKLRKGIACVITHMRQKSSK